MSRLDSNAFVRKICLLSTSALCVGLADPAFAQSAADQNPSDIIVTARRVEEKLQDVPISITVFNQRQLANNNVTNGKDLAQFTPNLAVNSRYGSDNTVFTIRGFYQEQRTFSTVGVFFADVVAPRGSGATFGGDGAGPGALFDLANIQVLKGPQGTLFGRNVTGGAVLLVPQKPTGKFEGYVEGSLGDYDMRRIQAVVNLPVGETFRLRLGLDRQTRDGYLQNIGRFGDGRFGNKGMGNVDYWAFRASAVADLTPNLENYTIVSYANTKSNGVIPKILTAYNTNINALGQPTPGATSFGSAATAQLARESATGNFWTVSNRLPDSQSVTETWQVINTTTWHSSDTLTIKNIASYGQFTGTTNLDLFGNYFIAAGVTPGTEQLNQVAGFAFTHGNPDANNNTNAQSSFVEELQFQGNLMDNRLNWQAGAYIELNDPLGWSGVQTASNTACTDITTLNCENSVPLPGVAPLPVGAVGGTSSYSLSKTTFRDYALYAQASYDITSQLKLTAGFRYTWDKMTTQLINETFIFSTPANTSTARFRCTNLTAPGYSGSGGAGTTYPFVYAQRMDVCQQTLKKDTQAPTWLVGLDYKPMDDLLLYAKYSRGYRQGGLAIFGPDPIQPFDKESVDVYEAGTKFAWHGAVPGIFNLTGFYNNFRDQQVQFGVACVAAAPGFTVPCAGNAAILNAGKSRMYGLEAELNLRPFQGMQLGVSYGYLNAKLKEITTPAAGSLPPYNFFVTPLVQPCAGEKCDTIANSGPPHKVIGNANYALPLSESIGRISFGGTVTWQARQRIVSDGVTTVINGIRTTSGLGVAPSSTVLNLNAGWENIAGRPLDLSFFMTNVTNEHVILQINDNSAGRNFVSGLVGEPRMYGFRLKYRFGS
jgi:iron complex outermembrane receptor protein